MIVRDDLKNSDFYNEAMKVYKKSVSKEVWIVLIATIYTVVCYVYDLFETPIFAIMILAYIGFIVFSFFQYKKERFNQITKDYDLYEIYVEKKWVSGSEDNKTYWITEDAKQMQVYKVENREVYSVLKEKWTYIFLAKNNILYEVVSIKKLH